MKEMEYKRQSDIENGREVLDFGVYDGFTFFIINFGTHPCCYVEIPDNHPLYLVKYDDIEIDCHGGLTFSSSKLNGIDETGLKWFIGWDFAHSGDYYHSPVGSKIEGHKWTLSELKNEVYKVCKQLKEWRIKKMKTIKIIDLINNIANGIPSPNTINYDGKVWVRDETGDYKDYGNNYLLDDWISHTNDILNDEVLIIDKSREPEAATPNKLEKVTFLPYSDKVKSITILAEKINEIIDKLNKDSE